MEEKLSQREKSIIVFSILACFWVVYYVWCFPGNMVWDSGTSIAWYLNLDRSNNNLPYFQNWLMGSFYSFGKLFGEPIIGIGLYCLIQMALEMILLTKIMLYLTREEIAGRAGYLPLILYCLMPLFPIYAMCMAKDANFGLAILLFEYYAIQYANEKRAFLENRGKTAGMAAAVILCALFRNLGGIIPAAVFVIITLAKGKKQARIISVATLAAVLMIYYAIPPLLGIPPGDRRENMSMPLQTTAYYIHQVPEEVTEEEKRIIDSVVGYEEMMELYNPHIADPIKDISDFDAEKQKNFLKMWAGMIAKHPKVMLDGFIQSTYVYYTPDAVNEARKPHASYSIAISDEHKDKLGLRFDQTAKEHAQDAVEAAMDLPVVGVFAKIGIYSWILAAITLLTIIFRRARKYFICCVPLIMVFIGCLLSPVNGYYRYAYSMILSIPVVLIPVITETVRGFREKSGRAHGK